MLYNNPLCQSAGSAGGRVKRPAPWTVRAEPSGMTTLRLYDRPVLTVPIAAANVREAQVEA
ncbi:MAG: hypothetical protein E7H57_07950 [Pantoea sp.]|nr:hypothetical protein [Pantoea sp.]